jgi:hypothetical protein
LGSDTLPVTGIDDQAPVDEPQGDVLDEINSDGMLPETGGLPVSSSGLPLAALTTPIGMTIMIAGFAVWLFGVRQE